MIRVFEQLTFNVLLAGAGIGPTDKKLYMKFHCEGLR
jgi:hypothetical protein